jgi:hypothetical protein
MMQIAVVASYQPRTYFPPAKPKAIYFTGAGIYFWWQAGCAMYLRETCDVGQLPIIGASAGSISAALLLSNADFNEAANVAIRIGQEAGVYERKAGLAGIWGALVKQWLNEMIPETVTTKDFEKLQVAVTTLKTSKSKLVCDFPQGKADVIEALLASCHVPVFLDGRPSTMFRGENVVDGSFWYFVTKDRVSGLPMPTDIAPDEIFWIDYGDDDEFMQRISGNILELVTPQRVLEMIDEGYNYMKREHYYGRLPMARFKKPNFVYKSDLVSSVMATMQFSPIQDFLSPIQSLPGGESREAILGPAEQNNLNATAMIDWTLRSFKIPTLSSLLQSKSVREIKAWTNQEDWEKYFRPSLDSYNKYVANLQNWRFDDL